MLSWLITMHNEFDLVQETVSNIKRDSPWDEIHIVQSDDRSGRTIPYVTTFEVLPDRSHDYEHLKLGSHSVCRNYSHLFRTVKRGDWLVALTGDTLMTDPTMADRLIRNAGNRVLICSQAIGQRFHAADGTLEGRPQDPGISDFMPQMFIVKGDWQREHQAFCDIPVVNELCTEQCLGDHFVNIRGTWDAYVISNNAYGYSDGISYQTKKTWKRSYN